MMLLPTDQQKTSHEYCIFTVILLAIRKSLRKNFPISTSFLLKISLSLFWENQKRGESDPFRRTPLFMLSPNAARGMESPHGRDSGLTFGWIGKMETRPVAAVKWGDGA